MGAKILYFPTELARILDSGRMLTRPSKGEIVPLPASGRQARHPSPFTRTAAIAWYGMQASYTRRRRQPLCSADPTSPCSVRATPIDEQSWSLTCTRCGRPLDDE